ncbi:MAG: hypothetical protein ACXWU2_03195 [Allosphingosinicella sp.]
MMQILRRIEIYLAREAMTPTRLGREAMGDPRFVYDLRNGRGLRPRSAAKVAACLAQREGE